jgi:hypothetical protein
MSESLQINQVLDADVEEIGDEAAVDPLPLNNGNGETGASWKEMYDDPWLLLSLLFFVTAALGIPMLWKSRAFSPLAKLLLTIVVIAYTLLLLWLTWQVMLWSYNRVAKSVV